MIISKDHYNKSHKNTINHLSNIRTLPLTSCHCLRSSSCCLSCTSYRLQTRFSSSSVRFFSLIVWSFFSRCAFRFLQFSQAAPFWYQNVKRNKWFSLEFLAGCLPQWVWAMGYYFKANRQHCCRWISMASISDYYQKWCSIYCCILNRYIQNIVEISLQTNSGQPLAHLWTFKALCKAKHLVASLGHLNCQVV